MYVDNELQQAERLEVENFVKNNPDLATELELLQQATITNEEVVFDNKELLYKKEDGISLENYEEYFVLSVDNELDNEQANEVEKFVLKHPELQDEFTLMKQTKLQPEVVEFTGKQVLFRTKKDRRIIPLYLMRVAVAAAVMTLIALTWIFSNNNQTTGTNTVVTASNQTTNKTTDNKKPATGVTQEPANPLDEKGTKDDKPILAQVAVEKEKVTTAGVVKTQSINKVGIKKMVQPVQQVSPDIHHEELATVTGQGQNNLPEMATAIKNTDNNYHQKIVNEKPINTYTATQKNVTEDNDYTTTAVYREIDTNEEDNSIYIGGAEINKNKLKGLFKKAAKLLGKKSGGNSDEKTLRIAVFEFKTK